ncbi:MAG: cytochrome C, partial [Acidovorax sp.]
LLQHLTDDYLREMADYFARLDLSYAPPVAAAVSAATLAQGETLVRWGDASRQLPACVQCHGDALAGVAPFIPGLLGLSRDYVSAQLGAWQTGLRRAHAPDCMARIASKLSADDVSSIAAWLSSRPVPSRFTPAPAFKAPLPIPCGGMGSPALQAGAEQVQ